MKPRIAVLTLGVDNLERSLKLLHKRRLGGYTGAIASYQKNNHTRQSRAQLNSWSNEVDA